MEHLSNELFRWLQAGRRRNFCLLPAKKAKQLRLDAPLVPPEPIRASPKQAPPGPSVPVNEATKATHTLGQFLQTKS